MDRPEWTTLRAHHPSSFIDDFALIINAVKNVKRFPGGLVFKARRLLCHSTLVLRVIKKKKKRSMNSHRHAAATGLTTPVQKSN